MHVSSYTQISTHTPLAGRDFYKASEITPEYKFLLTRPSRGATTATDSRGRTVTISTHTPLAGRDNGKSFPVTLTKISTHTPLAGRDYLRDPQPFAYSISTHTPLAGRDA